MITRLVAAMRIQQAVKSEDHLCKTAVMLAQIGITEPAVELDIAVYGGVVAPWSEAAVAVLDVASGDGDIMGHLYEVPVVAAFRA